MTDTDNKIITARPPEEDGDNQTGLTFVVPDKWIVEIEEVDERKISSAIETDYEEVDTDKKE